MLIAILNKSTRMGDGDVQTAVSAVARQMRYHAAPSWDRHAIPVIFYMHEENVPPGSYVISLFDDSDQAGALGWHTESPTGDVYGRVFVGPVLDHGGSPLTGPLSVASVLSHEVLEAFIDPACNLWADKDGVYSYAVEVGDPVEGDSYPVPIRRPAGDLVNVMVSNFVLPAWFDPQARAGDRLDWMHNVAAPFEMTKGGYVIVMAEGKVWAQFAARVDGWKLPGKEHAMSRTSRRGVDVMATSTDAAPEPVGEIAVDAPPAPATDAPGRDPHAPIG